MTNEVAVGDTVDVALIDGLTFDSFNCFVGEEGGSALGSATDLSAKIIPEPATTVGLSGLGALAILLWVRYRRGR